LQDLASSGIIALNIFEGAMTKEQCITFIRDQVSPKLMPYPGPQSVVVLDNCSIHHDKEVQQIFEDKCGAYVGIYRSQATPNHHTGGMLVYLLPYSLDFNPIKQAFYSIKARL
ncbi:hypothetical protein PAXRUDRAFT_169864, partial [Paxillus rubicundulus Ve08.2h10]